MLGNILYIYNYVDHVGNVRVSYTRVGNDAVVVEKNDYYAFGLKHGANTYDPTGVNYNYEYNGKENQQEIGMYDYGARFYMPDLGRWGVIDPLAEMYRKYTPYNYAMNNPMRFIDPDGRSAMDTITQLGGNWTNVGYGYFNAELGQYIDYEGNIMTPAQVLKARSYLDGGGGSLAGGGVPQGDGGPKPTTWQSIKNFFGSIFGSNRKDAQFETVLSGATISRAGVVEVGYPIFEGIEIVSFDAVLATITRVGVWSLPLVLKGDTPEREQMVTLYRGVSVNAKASMYFYASQGIAIPRGFEQVSTTFGPHRDMDAHAMGDNYSIWTSWSSNKEMAKNFATGVAFGKAVPGIILSKQFRISEITPNISATAYSMQESEWLVPGVVYGAKVQYVLPRHGQ